MKAFKFELKKILIKKKTWLMLILVLLYCIGLIFVLNNKEKNFLIQQKRYNENTIEEFSIHLSQARMKLIYMDNEEPENTTKIDKQKKVAGFYQELYSKSLLSDDIYNKMVAGKELNDSELSILFMNNKSMDKVILDGYREDIIDEGWLEERGLTAENLEKQIADYENIENLNIRYEPNPYGLNARNYIQFVYGQMNIFILLAFILFISIEEYGGETDEGSYKLIYTSPWSRKRLLLGKYIVGAIVNLLLTIISVSIVILSIGIIFKWGNMQYPIRVNEGIRNLSLLLNQNNDIYISSIAHIGFQSIGLIFMMLFQTVIGISLSILLEDSSASFGLVLGIMILSFTSSMFTKISTVQRFLNPWAFMNLSSIFSTNIKVSMYYGIMLQVLIMIVIAIYTAYKFDKKDLLGGRS